MLLEFESNQSHQILSRFRIAAAASAAFSSSCLSKFEAFNHIVYTEYGTWTLNNILLSIILVMNSKEMSRNISEISWKITLKIERYSSWQHNESQSFFFLFPFRRRHFLHFFVCLHFSGFHSASNSVFVFSLYGMYSCAEYPTESFSDSWAQNARNLHTYECFSWSILKRI